LIEKPICLKSSEFDILQDAVSKNKIHILEALMMQHHPWKDKVREIVDSEKYGCIISVETIFNLELTEKNSESYRYYPNLGGGVYFDCSPYWLLFLQYSLGLKPVKISASSEFDGPNNIDMDFEACLAYENGVEARFYTSYRKPYTANHKIIFEKAELIIRTFSRPALGEYSLTIKVLMDNNEVERITFPPQDYYTNQLAFFSDVIINGKENKSIDQSFERIYLMEQIYKKALKAKFSN
jgi:predicted dehydrogenase